MLNGNISLEVFFFAFAEKGWTCKTKWLGIQKQIELVLRKRGSDFGACEWQNAIIMHTYWSLIASHGHAFRPKQLLVLAWPVLNSSFRPTDTPQCMHHRNYEGLRVLMKWNKSKTQYITRLEFNISLKMQLTPSTVDLLAKILGRGRGRMCNGSWCMGWLSLQWVPVDILVQ